MAIWSAQAASGDAAVLGFGLASGAESGGEVRGVGEAHEKAVSPRLSACESPRHSIRMPSGVEPAEVIAALLQNARSAGDVVAAHLWLLDPESDMLRLVAADGPARPDSTPVPLEGTVLGSAVEQGVARFEPIQRIRTSEAESTVWRYALPVSAGDASGVAAIDFGGDARPDLERLTPVAGAMRAALAGALALHIARAESAAARSLAETSRDLARIVDPDSVVATALERAIALAGAQTGSVMLLDGDVMGIVASRGLPPEVVAGTRVRAGEGIAGWVLASGKPLVVEDLAHPGGSGQKGRHGVRSAVSVPIADDEGVLGVINVGSRTYQARYSRSHLRALESLGRSTAVALRNARAASTVRDLYFDTLRAFALAIEAKDPFAHGATGRVLDIAMALGAQLGLETPDLDSLRVASILHDIGMSAAGDAVAVRDRRLSTVEWGMLKMHPVIAAEVLSQAPALKAAVPIVYHHHEHYDGGGYVGGLAGEQIPLGSRILAVADAFVAMTSPRPHRAPCSAGQALERLVDGAGSQFDPHVVTAFRTLLASGCVALPSDLDGRT